MEGGSGQSRTRLISGGRELLRIEQNTGVRTGQEDTLVGGQRGTATRHTAMRLRWILVSR